MKAFMDKLVRTVRDVHDIIVYAIQDHPAATLWLGIVTPWVLLLVAKIVF